jgi:hypothetical protein
MQEVQSSVRAQRLGRGNPAVIGTRPLDRWLCVPVFRRVCPVHNARSVKASPKRVKGAARHFCKCVATATPAINIIRQPLAARSKFSGADCERASSSSVIAAAASGLAK